MEAGARQRQKEKGGGGGGGERKKEREREREREREGGAAWTESSEKAYRDAGLGYLTMTDQEIVERLLADPGLLRVPLVRHGNEFTAGKSEATWADWLRRPAGNAATR